MAEWFGICFQPRAWSWSPGIESPIRLPAWSLLLPLPVSLPLSLSVSHKKTKYFLKKKKKPLIYGQPHYPFDPHKDTAAPILQMTGRRFGMLYSLEVGHTLTKPTVISKHPALGLH